MARPNDVPVRPGDILAGKYRVEQILGAGNMGVVVAATHVDLGQRVALKFMLPGTAVGSEHRERFLREARAAVRLKSQHVARVLDVGTLEDEAPYIVMELLEGQDLDAHLKARGPLPFPEAVEYVLQACEAVGEAHAAGVVHRDLKPANLFLTEDVSGGPCIKVLDFGISKLAGMDLTLTQESQALGSPLYMSPEQMSSARSVDARSDVWALGATLYQLVAGRTPFHAETMAELCARLLTSGPTPLAAYRSDAPPGFEAVLLGCFERDRERRYPSVAAFAAALAPYAPEHARAYAGRVARAMGLKGGSMPSLPEIPSVSPAAGAPAAPRAAALSASSVVSATALTLSSSQTASSRAPRVSARARMGAALFTGIGILALGAFGLWLALRPSGAVQASPASTAAASPEAAAATALAPSSVVAEPAAPAEPRAAEPAPTAAPSATAAEAGTAASLAGKPSSHAAPARAAAPTNAKPKPARAPAAPASPRKRDGIL